MKSLKKIVLLSLFVCFFSTSSAFAADGGNIFQAIVVKAASVLVLAKNISYVIAGFGLIAFSWGAIFGKIAWKHFYNIAIGLFLLSAMGAFISFFITTTGQNYKGASSVGITESYQDYLGGSSLEDLFKGTNGSNGSI